MRSERRDRTVHAVQNSDANTLYNEKQHSTLPKALHNGIKVSSILETLYRASDYRVSNHTLARPFHFRLIVLFSHLFQHKFKYALCQRKRKPADALPNSLGNK